MLRKTRNRKKKELTESNDSRSFTDFVELIPFLGQTLRPAAGIQKPKASVPAEKTILPFKKEVKTLSAPTGSFQSNTISIKQMMEKKDEVTEAEKEDLSNRPQQPFSMDELKMYWRQFAFVLKGEGNESLVSALTKRDPKLPAPNQIHHELDNQILVDLIHLKKTEMLGFLRQKLQNWSIQLDFSVIENQEENVRDLNGKDRFELLAKKNSNLYSLQKMFNLDVEY